MKQVHSVIPNLKYKLLSSKSTMRKLRHKNKQLKIEQVLNQFFSSKKRSNFQCYLVCQLRNLIYSLKTCYGLFYARYGQCDSGHQ